MNVKKDKRNMRKNWLNKEPHNVRLDPECRICPAFDSETIAMFPVAAPGEMGFRVLDNFCEEHIQ